MSTTRHTAFLFVVLSLATVRAFAGNPAETAAPASREKPASNKASPGTPPVRDVEKAPDDFPLTLRGFFGKGDKPEISVQNKTSGKSVWIKVGSSHAGWKLESADPVKGRAVFSQGSRRVNLFSGGESGQSPTAGLKSAEDSLVAKKLTKLMEDPKVAALVNTLESKANATLREKHPEFFMNDAGVSFLKPNAMGAHAAEMKQMLLDQKTPEAESIKPLMIPLFDAAIQVSPPENAGAEPKDKSDDDRDRETLRMAELTDEFYRKRTEGAQ